MHGVTIHAHIAAQMVDGRSIRQLETNAIALRLALAGMAAIGFLVGWGFRSRRQGLLASGLVSAVIIAVDTIVFWQFRIILPLVLALAAWFLGESPGTTSASGRPSCRSVAVVREVRTYRFFAV